MKLNKIEILEKDKNKKGDLFGRLMGDLFHTLGYDEPRINIHKSGREIDLSAHHRTERKIAFAECKAHEDTIGGSDINKFVGVLDAEKRNLEKFDYTSDSVGYFVSLSGFKETAIQQEEDLGNTRVILLKPEKIIEELIKGKVLVSIEQAVSSVHQKDLTLIDELDLLAYEKGWVWCIYYSDTAGQTASHFALVHAEGKPLVKELADEVIELDKKVNKKLVGLEYLAPVENKEKAEAGIKNAREKYFNYLQNECSEIQFEGLPTDKDAGSVKVKLENIFVPLHLSEIITSKESERSSVNREGIGDVLKKNNRLAILAKPGGGKSTLIKRIAIAYAFPERRKTVKDKLPDYDWFPIFIRCRELGEKVTSSITDIIHNIPNRAEISSCLDQFKLLVSDALQKGTALILIDGLDEIAEDKNRVAFVSQLRTFLATYPNINIIVTSREAGFRIVGGSLATYCSHYTLSQLDESDIEELSVKWHKAIIGDSAKTVTEAKSLAALICRDGRIKVLAENPLLLTTLLFVKRWAGYLPTKKSVLYQEMIKLLLVTWNVEGHEQLDIDEAEPQLAFVAYWMTSNGEQTITEEDLKKCLFEARRQMPEILNFTKISPSDFIRRVESRSSLLIMSGHKRLETGQTTPIYEFLHLSFQEYLTAKAIVEKYIPRALADKTNLELLKGNFEKENWREVVPLVAVLSKTKSKELIEYLVDESRRLAKISNHGIARRFKRNSSVLLLGNCIANEVQISPDLLETSLEWFAKSVGAQEEIISEIILNSKFGETFRKKTRECFFSEYDDYYITRLGQALSNIYLLDLKTDDRQVVLESIGKSLNSETKEEKCTAVLALMNFVYSSFYRAPLEEHKDPASVGNSEYSEYFGKFLREMLKLLDLNDKHCFFAICWCLVWLERCNLFPDKYREEFVDRILKGWFQYEEYNLARKADWVLSVILRPSIEIDISGHGNFEQRISDKYNDPKNGFSTTVAVYLGTILNISYWNRDDLELFFNEKIGDSMEDKAFRLFAEELNIELKEEVFEDE